DWYGVRVPQEHLFELLRTPSFITWQDETWLFCCQRPMTYLGEWASVLKSPVRGAEPRAVFDSVFDPDDDSKGWVWDRLWGRRFDALCVYGFPCKTCNRFKSTWDMDGSLGGLRRHAGPLPPAGGACAGAAGCST